MGIAEFRTQPSLLRKGTFFLNRETNSQALRGIKKKKKKLSSKHTKKQTNIQLGFRKFREDQTSLSLLKLFKNTGAYFSLSSYLCRWLLYTDLRRAFQLQVTHRVSSEKKVWASQPQRGGGEACGFEFVSKPPLCPWGKDISKTGERNYRHTHTVRVGARRLSHGVNVPVRRPSLLVGWNQEMTEATCGTLVEVSIQKELEIFCWSLGRRFW